MSDEHMATAREVTRDWTPQTTLADSRRDIANALAAAEERGRRAGIEERRNQVQQQNLVIAILLQRVGGEATYSKADLLGIDRRTTLEVEQLIGGEFRIRALAPRDYGKEG